MKRIIIQASCVAAALSLIVQAQTLTNDYLSWSADRASKEGKAMRGQGQVDGNGGIRIQSTNKSTRYKIRATWMTPEVIRASARQLQLRNRLSEAETVALVAEAESAGDTVVLVEIDPVEGSGVVPLDWKAFLQAKGVRQGDRGSVPGVDSPNLRSVKTLAGVLERDYAYDRFWVRFPLTTDGVSMFPDSVSDAEMIVSIYDKEGRVSWRVPQSIRERAKVVAAGKRNSKLRS